MSYHTVIGYSATTIFDRVTETCNNEKRITKTETAKQSTSKRLIAYDAQCVLRVFYPGWGGGGLSKVLVLRSLMGTAPLTKNCHVLSSFLKIINTFLKMICASYSNFPRNSKMTLEFKQDKQFLSYWSMHYFDCFDPLLKTAWPIKISMPFWVPWTIYCKMHALFFKKVLKKYRTKLKQNKTIDVSEAFHLTSQWYFNDVKVTKTSILGIFAENSATFQFKSKILGKCILMGSFANYGRKWRLS